MTPASTAAALSAARVLDALTDVYDPELDEPITRLGFVTSCQVTPDGKVDVVLQLPTPQCAPNFAFLMAADARDAVRRLPGVRAVTIRLEDHYTGQEINSAINRGDAFAGAFPGESEDGELTTLRRELRLPHDPSDPAFVLPTGEALEAGELARWLRTARLVRMSLEVNGGICRSLLRIHRGVQVHDPEEEEEVLT